MVIQGSFGAIEINTKSPLERLPPKKLQEENLEIPLPLSLSIDVHSAVLATNLLFHSRVVLLTRAMIQMRMS